MMKYIPDDFYVNEKNMKNVFEILDSVPDTCMHFPGIKTLEDAIDEIRRLGEDKIAEYLLT